MKYEDVRTRVKRIASEPMNLKSKMNLANSLLGQVERCEGSGAKEEILKELDMDGNTQKIYSCTGPTTCGFGEGRKLGAGTWKYNDEAHVWEREK